MIPLFSATTTVEAIQLLSNISRTGTICFTLEVSLNFYHHRLMKWRPLLLRIWWAFQWQCRTTTRILILTSTSCWKYSIIQSPPKFWPTRSTTQLLTLKPVLHNCIKWLSTAWAMFWSVQNKTQHLSTVGTLPIWLASLPNNRHLNRSVSITASSLSAIFWLETMGTFGCSWQIQHSINWSPSSSIDICRSLSWTPQIGIKTGLSLIS